ncbi:MAG: nucleoside-diphosphate sugar epimerase/dehydratase [Acidimicrobiia bacterium]
MAVHEAPGNDSGNDHGGAKGSWSARAANTASRVKGDLPLALLDVLICAGVYLLLIAVRFDFRMPPHYWDEIRVFIPVACIVSVGCNAAFGAYGRTWRHASIDEALRLVAAGALAGVILIGSFVWGKDRIPLTVLIAGPFIVTFLFGMVRFQSRLFAYKRNTFKGGGVRVAIVGGGQAGAAAIREMQQNPSMGLVPELVVDDNKSLRWRTIHGVPIVGSLDDLPDAIVDHAINQILLAITDAAPAIVSRIAEIADEADIPVRVLRPAASWAHGMPRMTDIRALDIEDLVGRRQVEIDSSPMRQLLHGKRVLITGGGGWIGSEIARQVAAYGPAQLVLLDHDETHLHDAVQGLTGVADVALTDIRDRKVLEAVFERVRPEVVFHAAAHKHVPILEEYACEAARTNVFGTLNVLDACKKVGTQHVVCISTDKAATPNAVMGASKWVAEQLLLDRAPEGSWCAVRFGNVLGSRGSVIPTFQRQIAAGGPVTVTDPRMTRFFMSTDEAVRLVLHAAATSTSKNLLALEMGEQVNIYSLAERMIRLCGLHPHTDVEILVTGLRPGERLDEAVVGPAETSAPAGDGAPVLVISPVCVGRDKLEAGLATLAEQVAAGDDAGAKATLLGLAVRATGVPEQPLAGNPELPPSLPVEPQARVS